MRYMWIPRVGVLVAVVGGLLLASSGIGYQMGLWSLSTGFTLLTSGAFAGAGAVVLGLLGLFLIRPREAARGFVLSGVALLAGVLLAGIPWQWQRAAQQVPRIHDISTDTQHPPAFEAIVPLRAGAPNSLEYTPEVAAEQRRGYPDIAPLLLPVPPDEAYERALRQVRGRGWDVASADAAARRIEATATTLWFGFKDDVVITVREAPGGSRVDMRSVSRVGRSDIGTNARRIREFLDGLR